MKRSGRSAPAASETAGVPASGAQLYGLRDVERLFGVPRAAALGVIRSGVVRPQRGPRGAYLFSFPDLVLLRTAHALAAADIPARRITRSLRRLREQLPREMPLSGLRILADGDRIVVQEGAQRWQAESGQYLLALDAPPAGSAERPGTVPARRAGRAARDARSSTRASAIDWFERGCALEATDMKAAIRAYQRAVQLDASHHDARVNLGRLLQEQGRLAEAERIYRAGLTNRAHHPLLHFNLAVLLEDLGREQPAIDQYRRALAIDPRLADAHYNLSLIYQKLGMGQLALRHLREYKRLGVSS